MLRCPNSTKTKIILKKENYRSASVLLHMFKIYAGLMPGPYQK